MSKLKKLFLSIATLILLTIGFSTMAMAEGTIEVATISEGTISSVQTTDSTQVLDPGSGITNIDKLTTDILNFAKMNFNIEISPEHLYIESETDMKIDYDKYKIVAARLNDSKIIKFYVSNKGNWFSGFAFNTDKPTIFKRTFSDVCYSAEIALFDYRPNSLSHDTEIPVRFSDGSYRYIFKRILDGKSYEIYINAANTIEQYSFKDMSTNKYYVALSDCIDNGAERFDKNYALIETRNIAVNGLDMDNGTLKLEFCYDEPVLPWFNDHISYEDTCWQLSISDKGTDVYDIYVSTITGEVCEIVGEYIEDIDDSEAIEKDEARRIAENYFKAISPDKLDDHMFVGYSSLYRNGWTAFKYARVEGNNIYLDETMVVYLYINGKLNSFYQTVKIEGK